MIFLANTQKAQWNRLDAAPLQGAKDDRSISQGDALGYYVPALWAGGLMCEVVVRVLTA